MYLLMCTRLQRKRSFGNGCAIDKDIFNEIDDHEAHWFRLSSDLFSSLAGVRGPSFLE